VRTAGSRPEGPRVGDAVVVEGTESPPPHQLRGLGERCKLPQRSLGQSPSRNRIWCILALNLTSGGDNFNDFRENQLTKFRAVYTLKAVFPTVSQILFSTASRSSFNARYDVTYATCSTQPGDYGLGLRTEIMLTCSVRHFYTI